MEELQTSQNWGRLVNYSYTSIQAVHFTENEILITLLQQHLLRFPHQEQAQIYIQDDELMAEDT
jgi:hypothetical protein